MRCRKRWLPAFCAVAAGHSVNLVHDNPPHTMRTRAMQRCESRYQIVTDPAVWPEYCCSDDHVHVQLSDVRNTTTSSTHVVGPECREALVFFSDRKNQLEQWRWPIVAIEISGSRVVELEHWPQPAINPSSTIGRGAWMTRSCKV